MTLPHPHYTNSQNSIISFGYADFEAKIFPILYPLVENSTTNITIWLPYTFWLVWVENDCLKTLALCCQTIVNCFAKSLQIYQKTNFKNSSHFFWMHKLNVFCLLPSKYYVYLFNFISVFSRYVNSLRLRDYFG